jgi:hypothetical protein
MASEEMGTAVTLRSHNGPVHPPDDVVADLEREAAERAADPANAELRSRIDAAFAPFDRRRPAATGDLRAVLDRLEEEAFVDVDAPTTSARPFVPHVKRGLKQATGWLHRHVAQQVAALVTGLVGVARELTDRLEAVEARLAVPDAVPPFDPPWADWEDLLAGCPEPVLRAATAEALATAPPGAAATVAVAGAPDVLPVPAQRDLAALAAAAARPGGTVVVVGTDPAAWRSVAGDVVVDLAPGHPLHARTWEHLLGAAGLAVTAVHGEGGPTYAVVAQRPA